RRRRPRPGHLPSLRRPVPGQRRGGRWPDEGIAPGPGHRSGGREGRSVFGSLRGTVLERNVSGDVLLEVGGVGYRVAVPAGAFAVLEPGAAAFLFTYLVVRDDALALYGFPDRDQRDTFESLMAASGVGPKVALSILSVHSPATLRRAVMDGDLDTLVLVPGVG